MASGSHLRALCTWSSAASERCRTAHSWPSGGPRTVRDKCSGTASRPSNLKRGPWSETLRRSAYPSTGTRAVRLAVNSPRRRAAGLESVPPAAAPFQRRAVTPPPPNPRAARRPFDGTEGTWSRVYSIQDRVKSGLAHRALGCSRAAQPPAINFPIPFPTLFYFTDTSYIPHKI